MDGARFNKQMVWNMNRYAHIYALEAFIWGAAGAYLALMILDGLILGDIWFSLRLHRAYQMMGKAKTRDRIARLFFQRQQLRLRVRRDPNQSAELAVISRRDLQRWLEVRPDLADRAVFDPSGRIVLVRVD